MNTAREYWEKKFGEYPQNDADKLAVAMMQEYAAETSKEDKKLIHELCWVITDLQAQLKELDQLLDSPEELGEYLAGI